MSETAIVILVLAGWVGSLGVAFFVGWLVGFSEGEESATTQDGE